MSMNKPKVLCYIPLHYGGEYLSEAIKALEPYTDKIVILYSSAPSYGHGTSIPCPEKEPELMNIAYSASKLVEWKNISAGTEGQHRGLIFRIADEGKYDGVLTCDADEVVGDLSEWIPQFHASKARNIGFCNYFNFWKSFNHICRDSFAPIRYINLHNKEGQENFPAPIYHFGCAQRMEIIEYKLLIHGHLAEIRPGWLDKIYKPWYPGMEVEGGLHLVSYKPALWQAEPFDKTQLPDILKSHANYGKDVIL